MISRSLSAARDIPPVRLTWTVVMMGSVGLSALTESLTGGQRAPAITTRSHSLYSVALDPVLADTFVLFT